MSTKKPAAKLAARYYSLRSCACELVAEYQAAGATVPARLLRFAGLKAAPRQPARRTFGPKPVVLYAVAAWFAARHNEPATYREIASGVGLKVSQVRTCISRNEVEAFERVGGEQQGDKLYARVRLSAAGLRRVPEAEAAGLPATPPQTDEPSL